MMPLSAWPLRWEGYTVCLTLHRGEILAKSAMSIIPGPENSQPSLLALNDGRTLAYLRNPQGGSLLFSKLDANPKKWSDAKPLNLPSPDSPVEVIECQGGVLLVYTSDRKRRVSMSLAWAADGEHFNKLCDLGDGADVSASYPTIVRSADGDFHLIYTYGGRSLIKYVHLPKDWVQQRIAVKCLGRQNQ
jgi:predicted neuraminidase